MRLVTHIIFADAKAAAMASQIADLEARTIVANNRVIFTSTFEAVNMNAPFAYHRPPPTARIQRLRAINQIAFLSSINPVITA